MSYTSDQETEGSPTPPPEQVTVFGAIEDAPGPGLRKLVKNLWDHFADTRPTIDDNLRRPVDKSPGMMRKALEYCRNCHEYYVVDLNAKGVCRYHSGEGPDVHSQTRLRATCEIMQDDTELDDDRNSEQSFTTSRVVCLRQSRSWKTQISKKATACRAVTGG